MASTYFPDPNKTDLSKAVLTLTKHKQRLEEEHLRLLQQMARTQEELDTVQLENELLRSKLTAAQKSISDLQQKSPHSLLICHPGEDRGGVTLPDLSQQMAKGLSSFVTAPENSVVEQSSLLSSSVATGTIDVGRLAEENENLHRKLFELRSKNDSIVAEWKRQTSEKEKTKLEWENSFAEFRLQVEDLQSLCARLRHESIVDKSMLHVFEHFFKLSVSEIVFPQGLDRNSISPQGRKTSSGSFRHLESEIPATLHFHDEPVSSPPIATSKENGVERTITTEDENNLATVLAPCAALSEQMPLDGGDALPSASFSSAHISLQLPFSCEGLDEATLEGKDAIDSITSFTFYKDKFIRIGGALTVWITTLKKLLPLENQRAFYSTTSLTSVNMPSSARGDSEGDYSALRNTIGPLPPSWNESVPPKGQVRGLIDRLDDLLAQHTKLTKQITTLWENVIRMIHVSAPHPTASSPRKNRNEEGMPVTVIGSEEQRVEAVAATPKGWKKKEGEVSQEKKCSASSPLPGIVSTQNITLGEECDHASDGKEGVKEAYKYSKEKMLETTLAPSAPPQVLLCLLLIELVQALMKWIKILSQHLPALHVASASFSSAGRRTVSASLSLSQRSMTSKAESAADSFLGQSSTRRSPLPVGILPPSFAPSVPLKKIPPSPVITSTCSTPNNSELFSSLARESSRQVSYVPHLSDHLTSSSFASCHPKVLVSSCPSSSFPFPTHHAPQMDVDYCGNVVLQTVRGVLKHMRGLLMVLWNEYLKEGAFTASVNNETKIIPTSLECDSKLASTFSSLSLLSRILSPNTLLAMLSLIWKALRTTPELTTPLQELSVVFHEMALHCSNAHLRNVYHILCKELNHWKRKEANTASMCKETFADKMDRNGPGSSYPPPLDNYSSLDDKRVFRNEEESTCFSSPFDEFFFRLRRSSKCSSRHSFCAHAWRKEEKDANAEEDIIPYLLDLLDGADAAAGEQEHLVGAALWELAEVRENLMDREAQVKYLQFYISENETQFSAEREALQGQIWRLSEFLSSTASSQCTLS